MGEEYEDLKKQIESLRNELWLKDKIDSHGGFFKYLEYEHKRRAEDQKTATKNALFRLGIIVFLILLALVVFIIII